MTSIPVAWHKPCPDAPDPVEAALARSESTFRSPRMFDEETTDADVGTVRWKPSKSIWISAMTAAGLIAGPVWVTWDAIALFICTTALTVCLGHSLGMHRRLIHRAYECPLSLQSVC